MRITQGYIYYIHTLRFNHFVFTMFATKIFLSHSRTRKKGIWVIQNKEEALLRVKNIKDPKNVNNREVFSIYPHCLEVCLHLNEPHPVSDHNPLVVLHRRNLIMQHKIGHPPPQRRRQQGEFITDSVNYGFDEQFYQKGAGGQLQKGGYIGGIDRWVKRSTKKLLKL